MSFPSKRPAAATVLRFPGAAAGAPSTAASKLPVLIVLHQETSTPGRVGNALRALGHPLDVRRPRFGDPLPATLDDHAGAVVFGGPMSANDPDDFVRREIDWISVPLREQRPFLGICLGAQMLAMQLSAPASRRIRKAAPRSDITRSARPRRGWRSARTGRGRSTTGTAKDSNCPTAPSYWPKAATFRCRLSGRVTPSVSSFIPTSPAR
jgi:hypothetical protein